MITNERKVDALTDAAMEIYKHHEQGKGFYSGKMRNSTTGALESVYNDWDIGLRRSLESKLGRRMTRNEETVLALAIGRGPTPSLTKQERKYSMEFLWGEEYPQNFDKRCQDLMRVLTSF